MDGTSHMGLVPSKATPAMVICATSFATKVIDPCRSLNSLSLSMSFPSFCFKSGYIVLLRADWKCIECAIKHITQPKVAIIMGMTEAALERDQKTVFSQSL